MSCFINHKWQLLLSSAYSHIGQTPYIAWHTTLDCCQFPVSHAGLHLLPPVVSAWLLALPHHPVSPTSFLLCIKQDSANHMSTWSLRVKCCSVFPELQSSGTHLSGSVCLRDHKVQVLRYCLLYHYQSPLPQFKFLLFHRSSTNSHTIISKCSNYRQSFPGFLHLGCQLC